MPSPPTTPDNPWPVDPEPTNLMVAWPAPAPPTEDAAAAIAESLDGAVAPGPPAPADEIAWTAVVERDGPPVVVWAEPARPLPAAERTSVGLDACTWMLGIETVLAPADPLAAYATLLRALHVAAPASPALLDVNTTRWIRRDERLAWIAADGIGPPIDVLWIQQAVARDTGDANPLVWLHTHGLGRCGRPELEMLDVPRPLAAAAADLVDHLAGLAIDEPLPAPDVAWRIGPDLAVTLQPWSEVAPTTGPGGPDHRDDDAHGGARAVICANAPVGGDGVQWAWPHDVVARLAQQAAAVYRPARATARRAAIARATWAELAHAVDVAAGAGERVRVAVEAGFGVPGDETAHEHLWFEATRVAGERVHGRLLSSAQTALAPAAGSEAVIERADLTDWTVVMADTRYGPEDTAALGAALATLVESPEPAG